MAPYSKTGLVEVPHLVRSLRAKPNLRFPWMHAEAGVAPGVLPYEAVPGGGRGPARAEPLGEDGERAGRDVPIVGRSDHVLNRPDLGERQSRRGCAGTRGLIVERTRAFLPAPGMDPTRRHPHEPPDPSPRAQPPAPLLRP